MAEGKKALEFKHAHITGQTMRDHWGPIIDRIADETADWRDARIEALEAENERLREALRGVTPPAHFGESEQSKAWWAKARAALGEKQ